MQRLPLGIARIQAQAMAEIAATQHHIHLGQLHFLGTQRIHKVQLPTTHHQFGLLQQPRQRRGLPPLLVGQLQPGHLPAAIGLARHLQAGGIDVQLLQPATQQGLGGKRQHHARQLQGRLLRAVEHLHAAQFQGWKQSPGVGGDAADAHRCPYGLTGPTLQLSTPLGDSRHNQ